jgi:SAM-dependent methyltransferase
MIDWEARYGLGDTPWEKGEAAPPLLELMARRSPAELWGGGPVLVPGCGFGHDVRAIAATGVPVVGLDLAASAIAGAECFPKAGLETYLQGDLFGSGWRPQDGFAAWWEHTCFCAIPPSDRPRYARAAAELVRPGGLLCGVFYLTPNDPGEEDQGPPFNASIEEIDGLLAPAFERIDAWVPQQVFPGREGREWTAIYRRVELRGGH